MYNERDSLTYKTPLDGLMSSLETTQSTNLLFGNQTSPS